MIYIPFEIFPQLDNGHILLREVGLGDLQDLIPISFYDGKAAKDLEEAKEFNERIRNDYLNGHTIHWMITLKGEDIVLGTCGFYRGFKDNVGEIGYVMKESSRGKGLMTEAISLIVDFGFEKLTLSEIYAVTEESNLPSRKILEGQGFILKDKHDSSSLKYVLSRFSE